MPRWFYRQEGVFGDKDLGPFDDAAFKQLILENKLTRGTLVQKDGQWFNAGDLFGAAIDKAAAQAAAKKAADAQAKQEQKRAAKAEAAEAKAKEHEAARAAAEANARAAEAEAEAVRARSAAMSVTLASGLPAVASHATAPPAKTPMPAGALECPYCHQVVYPVLNTKGDGTAQALSCIAVILLAIVTCGIALVFIFLIPFFHQKSVLSCPNCRMTLSQS